MNAEPVMSRKFKTLILDDDPLYLELAASRLKEDFIVYTALRPTDAFDLLLKERIDVLICDFNLPEMDGIEVVRNVKEIHPETDVIMISGNVQDDQVIEAFDSGVIDFLQKPVEYKYLKISIERAKSYIKFKKKSNEVEKYNSFLSKKLNSQTSLDVVYASEAMRQVQFTIEELAKDDSMPVLITGELGLFKDSFARQIHSLSQRSKKNFLAVNTAAITDAMFEKKFFGYKHKSLGSNNEELGWFEISKEGTLFFDEIADLSIYQQAKLNTVFQNRVYSKIGSRMQAVVDVRLISACNGSLNDLKGKNNFRLDLLQKLNSYELYIPPLRDRQEDIPLLMNYFIRRYSERMRKTINGFDSYAELKLTEYSYPGNIQELSNLIERAVILCDGDSLNLDHFPSFVSENSTTIGLPNSFDLNLIERELIIRALKECNYNKTQAAKLLNVNWNALHRRLQKYKIDLPEHAI